MKTLYIHTYIHKGLLENKKRGLKSKVELNKHTEISENKIIRYIKKTVLGYG